MTAYLRDKFYSPKDYVHHDTIFSNLIKASLKSDSVTLDIGAGSGDQWAYSFKGQCQKVVGIDLDQRILQNPNLDEAIVGDIFKNQFPDASFDVVIANYFVEHISNPLDFLREMRRILRKDGVLFFRILNINHYAGMISRFSPFWFHQFYNQRLGRAKEEIFPAFYKLCSQFQVKKISRQAFFSYDIIMFE